MKTISAAVSAALALCAMQSFAEIHTVKFRRLNGTVFHVEQVEHGASAALPSPPAEAHFAFKGWDHGEWLACVTNDFSVYALYENDGSKTWPAGTGFGSKPIAERDEPYSLDEYFRMYDNVAWTDEFSRGSNTAAAINTSYWKYDTEDRGQLSYETSGENQVESNGCLTITIRRESTPRKRFSWATWSTVEYDFTAGGIRSDNKVAFKLGRCEIRAKLSRQRGAWPAFWMMGNSGQWPACGELDILEQPSGGDWISGGLHISPKDNRDRSIQNGATATPEDGVHFGDGFHRFGTIMNEREIVWYVDDHIFKRMDVRDSRYNMVRDRPWLIIIGMGLQTNTWVNAPDAPVDKYDVPELVDHVDYLVDYCRIYTNTNANNTLPYVPSAPGAKLSAPVSAVVWRGWDMNWGRPGAGSYQNNISKGYGERYYTKTALSEYMRREKTDFLAFLTNPTTAMSENLGQFDIPGYTIMSISANANNWNNAENENNGTGRLQLFCSAMFNTDRFSVSDSGVDLMKLSDDANFTNCYAVCGDLVEKATGARVKVVAVNVTTTNGVENAGGTVAQGFDTLFSRLNAIRDERVVVFFQGMSKALYNYIKARADSSLESPYAFAGNYTSTYANQCVYATANVSAAAAHPSVVPVPTKNLRLSYAHNPQALQTTVTFDELPGDGLTDAFVASDYAKSMDVTFSGYSGEALANFPVLVKLSTAIDGFSYSDFQLPDGGDLRFSDSDGKLLPHEIDTWNPNGVSTVWVKVPSLAENAKITAHYGCQSPARVDSSKVWDDDYVGVWHLGEEGLPLRESSRTSSDFTYSSGDSVEFASQGVVGGAVNFKSENRTNAVVAVDHAALDGFQKGTFEAWTKQSERVSNRGILSKSANKAYSYRIYDGSSSAALYLPLDSEGTNLVWSVAATPVFDVWNHLAYTFDATTESSNVKSYLDGAWKSTGSKTIGAHAGNANLCLGTMQGGNAANFVGQIDEVRISKCVRSAAWLKATHDTVANADFATYAVQGVEPPEPDPGPAVYGPLATNQYAKSMNVLFAGAPNNATLTNFPVLVKLSAAIDGFSYGDFSRQNGGDLRFADASGNLLPHEIDTWNPSGVSTVWVKVPLLKKNSYITAHYGFTGSGDPAAVDPKDVWDDDYVGVWHLGESALPLKESSETSSDFESSYGDTINYATNGIVGHAVGFPEGGLYNSIVAPDHDALDGFSKFTVEYWTFQLEHKSNAGVLSKRKEYNNDAAYYLYDAYDANSDKWSMPFCIGTNKNTSARWSFNLAQTLGEWNHIVYSADMSSTTKNVHGFKNGTMNGWEPNVTFFGQMPNSAEPLVLGNLGANKKDNSFNGQIDEVRISKTVRSKEWVKATYETIANDGFAVCSFGEIDFGESVSNVLLKASTDKANPIDYVEGEQIRFDFRLDGVAALPLEVRAREPLHVIWTRRADDGVTVMGTNTISLAQGFSVTTKLAIPGIVKMTGTLVGSDYKAIEYYDASNTKKNITFVGGAGVATEKMTFYAEEPADFDQFWAEAKAKLAAVPMTGTELVEVFPKGGQTNSFHFYAAKVPCLGPTPVTGWLVVPKNAKAKSLSIRATFAGYGCITTAPTPPTWGDAREIRFEVNAHGYDLVGHDNQYYQDFNDSINKTNRTFNGTTYTYALAPQDYDNPTNTYFYYMTLRAVRAFDYLKSRPEWDGTNVVATGGSQGGAQTMWAAGLVDGMTKIQPSITGFCDVGCPWDGHGPYPSRSWGIPCVPGAYYFDAALHAKRVPRNCVAEITRLGMGDYTCPPRGVLLSYYNMKCAVSAKLVQGSDHGYVPPDPNQTFTISKEAEAELVPPTVADTDGFDWTNRVVTVTGAQAGKTVTLSLSGRDGTPVEYTATADSSGSATFDVQTAPGASYSYTVTQEGAAPASGTFSTGSWKGAGTWFSGAVENSVLVASGGNWVGEPAVVDGGNALSGNASFALDADAVETGSNRLVRVDFDIVSGQFCLESDLGQEEGAMFGCIAAVASSAGNAWFAYDGSAWHRLYGDYTLAENAAYIVRAELDLAQGEKGAVRYYVSDNAGTSFTTLFADAGSASVWITCNAADSRAVKSVTAEGTKTLASVGGSLIGADIAEADGVGYESLADAIAASTNSLALLTNATWPSDTPVGTITVGLGGHSLAGVTLDGSGKVIVGDGYSAIPGEGKINISLAQAAALGVSTDGKSPAEIASALAENGANGIPRWQSYALGLDPADATAKPKATIAMNGENVELRLVGITVNAASGATVTYKVYKSADLADMANAEPASDAKAVDATASVPKGASEDRMFYQLKVDVKGY